MTMGSDNPIGDCLGRVRELERRVAALERCRSVEAWEDGPKRDAAPKRACIRCGKTDAGCYGDERSGCCETLNACWMVAETSVPLRNPAPIMLERGERKPLLPGRQEPQDARPQVGAADGLGKCRRFSAGTRAALAREAPCDPTGTDPMPVVSPGDSSFAVFTGGGRWES